MANIVEMLDELQTRALHEEDIREKLLATRDDRDPLGKPIMERDENCIYCKQCLLHCPDFAIEFIPLKEGEADGK